MIKANSEQKPNSKGNPHKGKQIFNHRMFYGVVNNDFDSETKDSFSTRGKNLISIPSQLGKLQLTIVAQQETGQRKKTFTDETT